MMNHYIHYNIQLIFSIKIKLYNKLIQHQLVHKFHKLYKSYQKRILEFLNKKIQTQ